MQRCAKRTQGQGGGLLAPPGGGGGGIKAHLGLERHLGCRIHIRHALHRHDNLPQLLDNPLRATPRAEHRQRSTPCHSPRGTRGRSRPRATGSPEGARRLPNKRAEGAAGEAARGSKEGGAGPQSGRPRRRASARQASPARRRCQPGGAGLDGSRYEHLGALCPLPTTDRRLQCPDRRPAGGQAGLPVPCRPCWECWHSQRRGQPRAAAETPPAACPDPAPPRSRRPRQPSSHPALKAKALRQATGLPLLEPPHTMDPWAVMGVSRQASQDEVRTPYTGSRRRSSGRGRKRPGGGGSCKLCHTSTPWECRAVSLACTPRPLLTRRSRSSGGGCASSTTQTFRCLLALCCCSFSAAAPKAALAWPLPVRIHRLHGQQPSRCSCAVSALQSATSVVHGSSPANPAPLQPASLCPSLHTAPTAHHPRPAAGAHAAPSGAVLQRD